MLVGPAQHPGRKATIVRRLQLEQAEVFARLLPDTLEDRATLLLFRVGAPPVEDVVVIPIIKDGTCASSAEGSA